MSVMFSKEALDEIRETADGQRTLLMEDLRAMFGDKAEEVRERFVRNAVAAWSEDDD